MSWILDKLKIGKKVPKTEEAWVECPKCKQNNLASELGTNLNVCPQCQYHCRLTAHERLGLLLESESFKEFDVDLSPTDPLKFKDKKKYKDRIKSSLKKSYGSDAIVTGTGKLEAHEVEVCIFDFNFMGGSMGSVVGEKITRSIDRARDNEIPLIIVCCSGGARMQEGILSLMQMAKTSAALKTLSEAKVPYISILTDPTMGGVSASFAMLGDIIIAEPGALLGFAGPRVIEQTIQQRLPEGFQTAEFCLDHGLIDHVVHRHELKGVLNNIFTILKNKPPAKPPLNW
jgi:acetyl-CoA carboxylase carboxyl transferase subunit beta